MLRQPGPPAGRHQDPGADDEVFRRVHPGGHRARRTPRVHALWPHDARGCGVPGAQRRFLQGSAVRIPVIGRPAPPEGVPLY